MSFALIPLLRSATLIPTLIMLVLLSSPVLAQDGPVLVRAVRPVIEGESLFIEVDMTAPIMPKAKTMYQDPKNPRLVLDFKAQASRILPSKVNSPSKLIRGIRIGTHKDRVRVVIDLQPGIYYEADQVLYKQINRYVIGLREDTSKSDTSQPGTSD